MENSGKIYDLEERTAVYAERIRNLCLRLPKNMANIEYIPQLISLVVRRGLIILKPMKVLAIKILK